MELLVDMDSTTPFAVLLIGQPTLRKRMKHGVLAALDQRISVSYQMPTMTKEETASYIKHHLTIASRQETLFSDDAVELIHLTSRGLPRSVNNIAWQSLIAAFTEEKGIVDETSTSVAITETHAKERPRSRQRVHDDPAPSTIRLSPSCTSSASLNAQAAYWDLSGVK
ncbi:hypothetical protein [Streptomyces sp. NPDC004728]|uniref:hypothetical protein n=1 Tax=Streptomyces sp. NPDC004728 TaxID=3154289 RepID=UPI0033A1AA27